jgi:hypothetical protein
VVAILSALVAILSAIFTGINLLLTYLRDRREKQRDIRSVEIVSSIENAFIAIGEGIETPYYRCTVTNSNVLSVQISSVGLASSVNAGMEIPLERAPGQANQALVQGASEVWGIPLHDLQAQFSGPSEVRVVAVATDTARNRYIQDQSKSLPIHPES